MKIPTLIATLALISSLGVTTPAHAVPVWRPCKIVDVLVRPDSLSVRCTQYAYSRPGAAMLAPEWFSVHTASSSAEYFDRVLDLLMTALVHDKEVNILYDNADKEPKNPSIITVDVFK